MESSNVSDRREDRLENSQTVTTDLKLQADEDGFNGKNEGELKGSFTVTSSSDQPSESVECNETDANELDKSLTLVVCRPDSNSEKSESLAALSNSEKEVSDDTIIIKELGECQEAKRAQKTKLLAQNADELATIDEEKPAVSCEDIVIIPTDNEADGGSRKNNLGTNDNKPATNPTTSEKKCGSLNNNSLKSRTNSLCDPVVELGKTAGNIESVKRNNKAEEGDRQAIPPSSIATGIKASTATVPVESNRKCRHSTAKVVSKNKRSLSLDNLTKGTQSGGIDPQITPITHKGNRLPSINNTDDRTSNNKKCNRKNSGATAVLNSNVTNNVKVRRTRCHSSHGERESLTNLQYNPNTAISRSYDKSVNILGSQNSLSSSERQRAVSVFEQRYTTRELRRALPRRSFFNCHEKAMKDAGLETDDPEKKRKAERLKARLERIANEFSPLPSARNKPDINETQGLMNGVVNITINDITPDTIERDNGLVESQSFDTNDTDLNNSNDVSSSKPDAFKLLVKPTHKKRPGSARQEHIDCKPLLQYLEYVKDNREEYLHHNHTHTSHSTKTDPLTRLISLGKAFELRHLGGIPKRHDDDVIVMAAKALRPRCSDPAKYTKIERDRSGTHRGQDAMRQARPPSEDKRKQESHAKDEEHSKSELEKKRIRAEEWTKSVSTNTLTKAKIQSLRELGADDVEIMKWWDAFKSCRYLRDTGPVEEKVF